MSLLHDLSVAFYLRIGKLTDRVEREESAYEHGVNETLMELDHIAHTAPMFLGTVGGWFT